MNKLYTPFQPLLTDSGLRSFELGILESSPSRQLRGVVHSYIQISAVKPTSYPMVPDGTQALFVGADGAMVSGGISQAIELQLPALGEYFGIRFYPGALRHLFNVDLNEISNQLVDSQFLGSPFIDQLHHHVYQYTDFQQRAQLCDQWLLRRLERHPFGVFEQALGLIYDSRGNIEIERGLAKNIGLSSRQLNRLFRRNTGFSTKSFAQTIRFQHACRQLYVQPENSLEIAMNLGYFDQAHLLTDFKKRLSQSPTAFFDRYMSDFYNSNS